MCYIQHKTYEKRDIFRDSLYLGNASHCLTMHQDLLIKYTSVFTVLFNVYGRNFQPTFNSLMSGGNKKVTHT